MLSIFKQIAKQRTVHRLFQEAIDLSKSGHKESAFEKLNELLQKHPASVYVRRQLLLLGAELHREVNLPELTLATDQEEPKAKASSPK